MRYFEDFRIGDVHELGSVAVTAEEIITFGKRYDPQTFHTDPTAAEESAFGGLVASGWLTASLFMRAYVEGLLQDSACAGSPGVDEIRYHQPVRPGDVLEARLKIIRAGPVPGRKTWGMVQPHCELLDNTGNPVFSMMLHSIFLRRPAPPSA